MSITREDVLTVADVAALLDLKPYTVKGFARRGILPAASWAAPGGSSALSSKTRFSVSPSRRTETAIISARAVNYYRDGYKRPLSSWAHNRRAPPDRARTVDRCANRPAARGGRRASVRSPAVGREQCGARGARTAGGGGLVAVRLPLDEYPTAPAAAAFLANAFRTPGERAASEARSLGHRLGGALSRAGQTVASEEASAIGGLLEGLKPEDMTLQRVLGAIPAELAKTGRRGAIAIDEAHVIAKWDPDDRASLRAFLARDDRLTGIALASSDSHAERKLKRSNVLGYLGEEFTLPAIEIGDWRHGLRSRFDQAEVPIDDEALELLLEESRCHPYCTMLLAKHAAELAQSFGTVTTSVIQLALPTVQKHEAWRLR